MMKTKWKCQCCGKTLASRQSAVNHVKAMHKSSDPSDSISKVMVEGNDEQKSSSGHKTISKEKKAYGYYSELKNIFNDNSMIENFSWGTEKKLSDIWDNPVPGTSSRASDDSAPTTSVLGEKGVEGGEDVSLEPSLDFHGEGEGHDLMNLDLDFSEGIPISVDNEDNPFTFDNFFPEPVTNRNHTKARSTFVPPLRKVCPDILDQTVSDFSDLSPPGHPGPLSCLSPAPPSEPGPISPCSAEMSYQSDSENPPTITVPLRTRGHCGRQECEGCNRVPCGSCYNCLNKRKKR